MTGGFGQRAAARVRLVGNPLVVGIDPHLHRLPEHLRRRLPGSLSSAQARAEAAAVVGDWAMQVLPALAGRVFGVKPQAAFFEQLGHRGVAVLEDVCAQARSLDLHVVLDAKRGDIASTASAYARAALSPDGPFQAGSVTVNPWMGTDTLEPFLEVGRPHGCGIFALLRTTNPGSGLLQHHGEPQAALVLSDALASLDDGSGDVGVVVGAQAASEARALRARLPHAWFLVPGLGFQGGSTADALAGARPDGLGVLPAASRSVLFGPAGAPDPGSAVGEAVANRADALIEKLREHAVEVGYTAWGA